MSEHWAKVHIGVDDLGVIYRTRMAHVPRKGDVLRFCGFAGVEGYATVIDVCFCLDEHSDEGQRVNISASTDSVAPTDSEVQPSPANPSD